MGASLSWTVTVTNTSDTAATVQVVLKVKSTSGTYNKQDSCTGTVKIDGTSYSFKHYFSANTTTTLTTKSKSCSRTTSNRSVSLYASYKTGVSPGTITKSGSTTVSARPIYTVTFANGYGGTHSTATVYSGYTTTFPSISRTGYTFGSWSGYAIRATTPAITSSRTYTASWIENTATLTYNANGHGVAPAAVTMRHTAQQTAAAAITGVEGYHFTSWNTRPDGSGSSYAAGAVIKAANVNPSATTLYAQWALNTYTINFNVNDDPNISPRATVSPTSMVKTHGVAISLPEPTWEGHIFSGWNTVSDGTGVDLGLETYSGNGTTHEEEITLYAQWSDAARPIWLHYYNSATNSDSISILYKIINIDKTEIADPSLSNYVFKGWFSNAERTQSWTEFDYEDDLLVQSTDTTVVTNKAYYTADTINKRWVAVETPTGNPSTSGYFELNYENASNNPLHLYAKWNEVYTVVYNINEPSYNDGLSAVGSISPMICENGGQITLSSSSTNYTYGTGQCTASGWSLNSGDNNNIGSINGQELTNNQEITLSGYTAGHVFNLYAVWTPTEYKVTFTRGAATSGADVEVSKAYYTTYTLPSTISTDWNWTPQANHHLSNWLLGNTNVPLATKITITGPVEYTAAWVDSYHVPVITDITPKRFIDANYTSINDGGKYIQITAVGNHGSYDGVTITEHTYNVDVKFYDSDVIVDTNDTVAHYVLVLTSTDETFSQTWGLPKNPNNPYERPIFDKKLNMLYCVLTIIDTTEYGYTIDINKRTFTYEFAIPLKRAIGMHMADDLSAITMFDELADGDEGLIVAKQFSMSRLWTWTVDPQTKHLYLNWTGGLTNE